MLKTEDFRDEFHFHMLQKYHEFFNKIDTEALSSTFLQNLDYQVNRYPSLSEREKELHQSFINQFIEMNERIKTLHWMSKHLKVLHDLGQTFSYTFEKEKIYKKAYELVSSVMDTDAFVIALYNEGDQEFHVTFSIDNGVCYDPVALPLGEGIISKVIETKETIHIRSEDEAKEHSFVQWGNPNKNTQTNIFVPMILNNQIKGVISAQNYRQSAYRNEHEELLRIIGVQVASAIETATLYDKIYEVSVKDDLTNIKNSRKFHMDLENKTKLNICGKVAPPLSLIMLDSDNLKKVNDQYGHHVGDQLIQYISKVLQMHLEEGEEAYRYAGDEFMIISPVMDEELLMKKLKKIQTYLVENPIHYLEHKITATVSVGISQFPSDTRNGDELKRLADLAMYQSKKDGKNRVTLYRQLEVD